MRRLSPRRPGRILAAEPFPRGPAPRQCKEEHEERSVSQENGWPLRNRRRPDDGDERHENDIHRHGPVDDKPGGQPGRDQGYIYRCRSKVSRSVFLVPCRMTQWRGGLARSTAHGFLTATAPAGPVLPASIVTTIPTSKCENDDRIGSWVSSVWVDKVPGTKRWAWLGNVLDARQRDSRRAGGSPSP